MFTYPFRLPFNHPFQRAFMRPGFGASPYTGDTLLVWIKDLTTSPLVDSWVRPDAENMVNTSGDLYAFESFTVGYMSVTDEITLPFEVPDDGAIQNNGTCTLVLDTVNNKITCTVAGVVRDIEITGTPATGLEMLMSDGTPMLMSDGTPMDHSS